MSSKYSLHVYIQAIIYQCIRKCEHKTHTDIYKYAYIVSAQTYGCVGHTWIYSCTHTNSLIHKHTCTHTHTYTHVHICMHRHTHACSTCTFVHASCIHMHVPVRIHLHTCTHAYTCAHTRMHTYTQYTPAHQDQRLL